MKKCIAANIAVRFGYSSDQKKEKDYCLAEKCRLEFLIQSFENMKIFLRVACFVCAKYEIRKDLNYFHYISYTCMATLIPSSNKSRKTMIQLLVDRY